MTLYEIIKNIQDITKIALVNSNFIGDIYELNHRQDIQYPACVITQGTHQTDIQNDTDIYNLNIFLVDRLLEDKSNELDVQDWAEENLSAIIDAIQQANIGYQYGTSEINTFTEKFDSLCAGAFANIKIQVEKCCCREVKIVTSVNGQTGDIFIQGIDGKYVKTVNGKDGNVTLKTSDIENNSGYITKDETVDIDIFNEFVNNQNVINENQNTAIEGLENTKADKTELGNYNRTDNFKTINNESIIGTGNIEIQSGGDNTIVYLYYDDNNFTDAEGNILTNNDVIQKAKDNTSLVVLDYYGSLFTISTIDDVKIIFCNNDIYYITDEGSDRTSVVQFIEVSTDNVELGVVDVLTPALAEEYGFLTDVTLPGKLKDINGESLILQEGGPYNINTTKTIKLYCNRETNIGIVSISYINDNGERVDNIRFNDIIKFVNDGYYILLIDDKISIDKKYIYNISKILSADTESYIQFTNFNDQQYSWINVGYQTYSISEGIYDLVTKDSLKTINISEFINDVPYATVDEVDQHVNYLQESKAEKTELTEVENRLTEKINEIQLYKIPNLTIFGEPTIQNGQISNFSTSNYAQFPFLVDFKNRAFEIKICLTTGNQLNVQENILDSLNGLALAIRNGHFVIAMSSDGQTWDMGEHIGNINLQTNTTYYINFSWNRLDYKLEVSTDKESYTTDITVSNTKSLYAKQIIIGKSLDNSYVFSGSINLNYCSLSIMNQQVWQGMDDVGLATRLAIDMSNIDSIGIEKVKEIVSTDFATKEYVDNIVGNISDVLDIILGDNN